MLVLILNFCLIVEARELSVFISQMCWNWRKTGVYANVHSDSIQHTLHVYLENTKFSMSKAKEIGCFNHISPYIKSHHIFRVGYNQLQNWQKKIWSKKTDSKRTLVVNIRWPSFKSATFPLHNGSFKPV